MISKLDYFGKAKFWNTATDLWIVPEEARVYGYGGSANKKIYLPYSSPNYALRGGPFLFIVNLNSATYTLSVHRWAETGSALLTLPPSSASWRYAAVLWRLNNQSSQGSWTWTRCKMEI